jgi:hypothetical protein
MEKALNEKAKSSAQQRLMGQAYGIKTGELTPSDLDPKYQAEIMSLARKMTKKQLDDFASTKTKKLPHYVKEEDVNEKGGLAVGGKTAVVPLVNVTGAEEFSPSGPGPIVPFLDTDVQKKKKGKKNLQNLKDYRDWVNENRNN